MGPSLDDEGEGVGHVIRGITDSDGGSGSEEDLGNCRNLILNNNRLTGEIPFELFRCTNLKWISLTSKKLSGEIPKEFGLWTRLVVLQLGNNSLGGQIPGELANCNSLVWLDLNSNRLTGEIHLDLGGSLGPIP
ncbi:hypothetical protein GBA52_003570 [Prunus armeniaca]|nr:hypothetical protein GBA52_003570 [Prunus armeniaca]